LASTVLLSYAIGSRHQRTVTRRSEVSARWVWRSALTHGKELTMLWTIAVLLLILWLLGMISSYTLGGFIHILLVLAIVAVLIRIIQGRNPVL
jgi:hypothetical protein